MFKLLGLLFVSALALVQVSAAPEPEPQDMDLWNGMNGRMSF
nr:venom peptide [Acharia stimulea]